MRVNPFTSPACEMSGLKYAHIHTCANSISEGRITSLLSVLCILIEVLSLAQAKGKKVLNDFKFGIFTGHFPDDDTTSMAVKGLLGLDAV